MKKMFALVLAIMLVMAMGVNAMAADVTQNGGSSTGNVTVDITNGSVTDSTSTKVYHVVVAWVELKFEYEFTGYDHLEKKWDPASHSYVIHGEDAQGNFGVASGQWIGNTSKTVTVTNHSNNGVTVSPTFDGAKTVTNEGITATLSGDFPLANGETTDYNNAPSASFTVSVDGVPTTTDASAFPVATITVTIRAN